MDLCKLTPDQRDCVAHVNGPLLVSAGAGSGKTFMLTQRIAYALLHPEESGVDDIEQVLAITFTELAAGEIKARVRTQLREEGLAEQALKVDASWIGTIHGMCSRILHECALEVGLDPAFGLLDETDRDQLLLDCVNAALAEVGGACGADGEEEAAPQPARGYEELFDEYEKADGPSNVGAMVTSLINAAANVRGGLDAVVCADPPSPHALACDVYDAMVSCDAVAREGIGTNGKAKETFTKKARDVLEHPEYGMAAFERLAARRDCTYADVAAALKRVDLGFGSRTSKEPYATAYAVFRAAFADACAACALGLALPARSELLNLARKVQGLFDAAKAERGALDQNDLLLKTLAAFEANPVVAKRYRDRFRLVMIDEFQDTSALQIALTAHLTDGDRRLCTVGDTQQSIYRFRGADVDTYRAHKRAMRGLQASGGLCRELRKNFRSHGDVIAFVNRVFGSPEVFGGDGEFIELDWVADHAAQNPFCDAPRIDVVAVTNEHQNGVHTRERHLVEAEAVARRFEALHADAPNRRWGDMVILLGKMTNADIYARTLRAHGIPCIVTGGSGFSWTPEAQEVGALLCAVADPWDNAALRRALAGAAFGLGADELFELGCTADGEKRPLWAGLLVALGQPDASPRARLAASLLSNAVANAGTRGASWTLLELAVASGWLDRLQSGGPQGMASAANALKAIRLAESIENDASSPRGIPATAARLALKLAEGMKEKPGVLMAEAQDAVRILTIHASKGLEFPIVALADFYGARGPLGALRLETAGDTVFLSLRPSASVADGTPFEKLADVKLTDAQKERLQASGHADEEAVFHPKDARTALALDRALASHGAREELGELRRKFYVGATRPREALILAVNAGKDRPPYGDVLDDLRRGLFGEFGDFCTAPEGLDFGGERRAVTQRIRLSVDDAGTLLVDGEDAGGYLHPAMLADLGSPDTPEAPVAPASEALPEPPGPGEHLGELLPAKRPCDPLRAGSFSYSRIARSAGHAAQEPTDPDELWQPDAWNSQEPSDAPGGHADAKAPTAGSAVAFGSALHQACALMAEAYDAQRRSGTQPAALQVPDNSRLLTYLRQWGADTGRLEELACAARRWAASSTAQQATGYARLLPEAPFVATLQGPQGEPLHLEGSIDLLCCDPSQPAAGQTALVVDYKTGGSPLETPEQLHAKHELQAMCYAYAVLKDGYGAVDLQFVRVQQPDPASPDQPQVVAYRFERSQRQELAEALSAAYATSSGFATVQVASPAGFASTLGFT